MTTVNVQYIGRKPFKADNVAGTGIVWRGHGDVQLVPVTALAKLLEHPAVWALGGDSASTPTHDASAAPQETVLAAAAVEASRPTVQPASPEIVYVLLAGSNHPDATFLIAPGIEVQRDDAITHTFRGTGLAPADWNALTSEGRTAYVDDYLKYRHDRQDAVDSRAKFAAALQSLKVAGPPPAPDVPAAAGKTADKTPAGQSKPKSASKAAS